MQSAPMLTSAALGMTPEVASQRSATISARSRLSTLSSIDCGKGMQWWVGACAFSIRVMEEVHRAHASTDAYGMSHLPQMPMACPIFKATVKSGCKTQKMNMPCFQAE